MMKFKKNDPLFLPYVNTEVEHIFDEIELELEENIRKTGCLDKKEVIRRIKQLILVKYQLNFFEAIAKEKEIGMINVERNGITASTGGKEKIKFSLFVVARELYLFFIYISYGLVQALRSFVTLKGNIAGTEAVVTGDLNLDSFIENDQVIDKFQLFCDEGPLKFLNTCKLIITKDGGRDEMMQGKVIFSRNPYFKLLKLNPLGFFQFFTLLSNCIKTCCVYLRLICQHRGAIFLSTDLGWFPFVKYLNDIGVLSHIVKTNSDYLQQEVWLNSFSGKKFSSNMVWYSTNCAAFDLRESNNFKEWYYTQCLNVERHWVWSKDQKSWLEKEARAKEVRFVSPILWYPFINRKRIFHEEEFVVTIFDVAPCKRSLIDSMFSDKMYYYYSYETAERFLMESIESIESIARERATSIKINIKEKRVKWDGHDERYHYLLSSLTGRIKSLPCPTDLFETVFDSDLIIVMPYSSPAYIAAWAGVKSIYFDPINALNDPSFVDNENIIFCNNKKMLKKNVESLLGFV